MGDENKMLLDTFGYIKRNSRNWNRKQLEKLLVEVNQIKSFLERRIKEVA
jgi:hypothetical protein